MSATVDREAMLLFRVHAMAQNYANALGSQLKLLEHVQDALDNEDYELAEKAAGMLEETMRNLLAGLEEWGYSANDPDRMDD